MMYKTFERNEQKLKLGVKIFIRQRNSSLIIF